MSQKISDSFISQQSTQTGNSSPLDDGQTLCGGSPSPPGDLPPLSAIHSSSTSHFPMEEANVQGATTVQEPSQPRLPGRTLNKRKRKDSDDHQGAGQLQHAQLAKHKCPRNGRRPPRVRRQPVVFGAGPDGLGVESEDEEIPDEDLPAAPQTVVQVPNPTSDASQEGANPEDSTSPALNHELTAIGERHAEILTPSAIAFISALVNVAKDSLYHTNRGATYTSSIHSLLNDLISARNTSQTQDFQAPNYPTNISEAASLAKQCMHTDSTEAKLHVKYYFTTIMLAAAGNR